MQLLLPRYLHLAMIISFYTHAISQFNDLVPCTIFDGLDGVGVVVGGWGRFIVESSEVVVVVRMLGVDGFGRVVDEVASVSA